MRFLIDAQLPPALARQRAAAGFDAEHVGDCGLESATDGVIWRHAERSGAVVVTKDLDFARRKVLQSSVGPQIVWVRLPNTRRGELLKVCADVLPDLLEALGRGEPLVEIAGGTQRGPAAR